MPRPLLPAILFAATLLLLGTVQIAAHPAAPPPPPDGAGSRTIPYIPPGRMMHPLGINPASFRRQPLAPQTSNLKPQTSPFAVPTFGPDIRVSFDNPGPTPGAHNEFFGA